MLPLVAAFALIAVHLITPTLKFLDSSPRSAWLSFAGGASVAYVFLHLLPDLAEGAELISGTEVPFGIWGIALAALLTFYGVERAVQKHRLRQSDGTTREKPGIFWIHLGTFAVYSAVTGYLLVHREGEHDGSTVALLTYTVAMGLHLLVADHGLIEAFREGYMRVGRWVLSASVVGGCLLAQVGPIPEAVLAAVTAVLGGGVILNVLKEELPRERESKFGALLLGAAAFAALLFVEELAEGGHEGDGEAHEAADHNG